jgi:DNA-binding transcriptional LysR family regulator
VAESASFSEAARKLRLPRSSVSRSVAELEKSLRVPLFNRTTRKVSLSTAGASLYERVAPQLASLKKCLGSLPELDEQPSGKVRLTAPTDMGVTFLPEVLGSFAMRYPAIGLDVRLTSRMVDVVGEGFDVALRVARGKLADSSLVARRLTTIEAGLFASPGYVARRGAVRSLEDAASHDWITFRGQPPPPPFHRPARAARIDGDDMLFVHQAARAGMGLAFLPTFLTKDDLAAGRLVRLLPRVSSRAGVLHFVHPAGEAPRKVVAFRDFLVEYLAAHPL